MAQQILACIYGQNKNDWGNKNGTYLGFPTQNVVFIPLGPGEVMSTVNMRTVIKLVNSNESYTIAPEFFTDRTIDSLITASNL